MTIRLLAFALGVAAVFGARLAAREGPSPPPAPEPDPTPASAFDAPVVADALHAVEGATDPACAPLQAAVLDRLDEVQAQVDELEALREALTGAPVPWPDDAPAHVREDALRARMQQAAEAAGNGLALAELRCEEYPCLGLVTVPRGDTAILETYERFESAIGGALEEAGPAAVATLGGWGGDVADEVNYFAIAVAADEVDPDLRWRLRHRMIDALYQTSDLP